MVEQWADQVIKKRVLILIATVLLLVVSIISITKNPIGVNNSNEMWFLEGDPTLLAHDKMRDLFGSTESLVVGIEARPKDKDLFELETIKMIEEIHSMLEEHEVVEKVDSLARYQRTYNRGGMVATDYIFEDIEDLEGDLGQLNSARIAMRDENLALDTLISKDFRHTRIIARTEYIVNGLDHKLKVVTDLRNFVNEKGYSEKGYNIKFGGQPVLNERFTVISNSDSAWLNPTVAIIMMIVLGIVFRSVTGILACVLARESKEERVKTPPPWPTINVSDSSIVSTSSSWPSESRPIPDTAISRCLGLIVATRSFSAAASACFKILAKWVSTCSIPA